jgi:hypothetical protein
MRDRATFDLAQAIRTETGAQLADVFSFLSGLYFRGKIAYARKFVRVGPKRPGIFVITAGRGLLAADTSIGIADLRAFADVSIDVNEPRYREPLERDVAVLDDQIGTNGQVVLLGSVASNKYVQILTEALGSRLHFPQEFVGRGDMSRGGLMLRCVHDNRELNYVPVLGAVVHGTRPARLPKPHY